ncbi:hypothetical protein HPB52_011403 [Rhipicephalus sanguineus]|uniref:Uncharacterized protein n=1 Tax=Rhipicephalus sanguineus TaxID=34632 RepID=A0A9D4PE19_RHISA|nr:hypothetical protein HPB52_011403 [Rhipicephalus sanguineus]
MPSSAYVCTVSQPVREGTYYLPPDGMCDFMFYDSLYKNGKNNLLAGLNTLAQDVRYFIEQASKYIKTQFGLSFAPEQYTKHGVVTAAITVLMVVHVQLQSGSSVTTPSYYVVGMSLDNSDNSQILGSMK